MWNTKVWNPYPYLKLFPSQKRTDLLCVCICFCFVLYFSFCFLFPTIKLESSYMGVLASSKMANSLCFHFLSLMNGIHFCFLIFNNMGPTSMDFFRGKRIFWNSHPFTQYSSLHYNVSTPPWVRACNWVKYYYDESFSDNA